MDDRSDLFLVPCQRNDEAAICLWQRVEAERDFADHTESAPRAGHQARQIKTCNILDDLAAAADDVATTVYELEPEHQVARQSKARRQRARGRRSYRRADGSVIGPVRIERQPLIVLARDPRDFGER